MEGQPAAGRSGRGLVLLTHLSNLIHPRPHFRQVDGEARRGELSHFAIPNLFIV